MRTDEIMLLGKARKSRVSREGGCPRNAHSLFPLSPAGVACVCQIKNGAGDLFLCVLALLL